MMLEKRIKFENRDIVCIVMVSIGTIFFSFSIFIRALRLLNKQPIVCTGHYWFGCNYAFQGIGFLAGLVGILFLIGGLMGIWLRRKRIKEENIYKARGSYRLEELRLRKFVRIALVLLGVLNISLLLMDLSIDVNKLREWIWMYGFFYEITIYSILVSIPLFMIIFGIFLEYHTVNKILLVYGVYLIFVLYYFGMTWGVIA